MTRRRRGGGLAYRSDQLLSTGELAEHGCSDAALDGIYRPFGPTFSR